MSPIAEEKIMGVERHVENTASVKVDDDTEDTFRPPSIGLAVWQKLLGVGVELRGLEPVPLDKRTDRRYINICTILAASMISLLPLGIGLAPTLVYGLSFSHAAAMIICLQFVLIIPSAYIATIAPKTGMRQMVQARYSFGKYFNGFNSLLVTLGSAGFGIIACVQGSQVLTSINPERLPIAVSITIMMLVSLFLSFMGYSVLHFFARWAWTATLFAIVVLTGTSGDKLYQQAPPRAQGAPPYMGMVALAAANMLTWVNIIGDYASYMAPEAPSILIMCYVVAGLAVPFSLLMLLGAAIGGAIPVIPAWAEAYKLGGIGGVIGHVLIERLGGFGKFILVILAFSVVTTCARDLYTVSFNVPAILPPLRVVPRIVWAIVATGAMIGVAIAASASFLESMASFLHICGYTAGTNACIYLVEWFYFRKANPASMDPAIWDDARALPSGIAAAAATFIPWALIVPSMQSAWYTGPIAKKAGDLGFEFAVVGALLVYAPVRALEIKYRGHL
ncbi:NCS1 nucleoside transporter [Coccidioides immitis RS]|uniref:NCS1 nucleoside transporter n=4 Tax=Coccidioides immitis TaxID=5501 RepID=A0A0E1S274_COCIM|nr:NCS1 nucleoside transporter [Coccidioides immitis RS]EAS31582.2 NCS1 nucleoside transporter [Coccidioides immitis RS]KMP04229.1 hypothetical protein CIRG_03919 [Coccidioides immitis RMSCC 2394]KMU87048.1 hypothetical protein CIHG_04988 [Coccidioides immitis H538.4]